MYAPYFRGFQRASRARASSSWPPLDVPRGVVQAEDSRSRRVLRAKCWIPALGSVSRRASTFARLWWRAAIRSSGRRSTLRQGRAGHMSSRMDGWFGTACRRGSWNSACLSGARHCVIDDIRWPMAVSRIMARAMGSESFDDSFCGARRDRVLNAYATSAYDCDVGFESSFTPGLHAIVAGLRRGTLAT